MENNAPLISTTTRVQTDVARFMSKVYGWMTMGIALTGAVSFYTMNSPALMEQIFSNRILFFGLIIAELALVIFLSARIQKISSSTASTLYLFYSALTGVTLSVVFYTYTNQSVANVFMITALGFAGLTAVGSLTKRDLGPIGSFCSMGLFGLIGWGLLSIFFPSMMGGALSPTYSVIGLIVFSGLTAYDTQKIKNFYAYSQMSDEDSKKSAVHGALILYLDFINLFLSLLRLMGNRK